MVTVRGRELAEDLLPDQLICQIGAVDDIAHLDCNFEACSGPCASGPHVKATWAASGSGEAEEDVELGHSLNVDGVQSHPFLKEFEEINTGSRL